MSQRTRAREAEAGKGQTEERGDKQIKHTKPPKPRAAAGTALGRASAAAPSRLQLITRRAAPAASAAAQ